MVDAGPTEAHEVLVGEGGRDGDDEEDGGLGARARQRRRRDGPEEVSHASALAELGARARALQWRRSLGDRGVGVRRRELQALEAQGFVRVH